MTPMRLLVKSYLSLVSMSFPGEVWRLVSYSSFHLAECITSPLNVSNPSMLGHDGLFRFPRALINTSDWSRIVSPVVRFLTVTCHFAIASSHRHSTTSCESLMNRSAEYFLAVRSR
jgi:hypothetical protein